MGRDHFVASLVERTDVSSSAFRKERSSICLASDSFESSTCRNERAKASVVDALRMSDRSGTRERRTELPVRVQLASCYGCDSASRLY